MHERYTALGWEYFGQGNAEYSYSTEEKWRLLEEFNSLLADFPLIAAVFDS